MVKQVIAVILLSISAGCALAKPYYFFQEAGEAIPKTASEIGGQVQEAATGTAQEPMPQRFTNHLGQLYNHGSSAIKGVADTVHPDLKNIGQDVADAFHTARDNVQKKIEPLAQPVGPYIEHAQKAVKPFVNQAREEVPKALGKVGEQVRGAWEKLTSSGGQQGSPMDGAQEQVQQAGEQIQQAGEQVQHTTTNAVQQATEKATQMVGA